MKYLLILFIFASCSKDPMTFNRCGQVVGKRIDIQNKVYYLKVSFSGSVREERVTELVYSNSYTGETKCFN